MNINLTINGKTHSHDVEPRLLLIHYLREVVGLDRAAYRLRDVVVRRLHRGGRRESGEELHHVRGAGRWRERHHD